MDLTVDSIPAPPTGTFTLVAPAGRKFSLVQIMDTVNDGLERHKYVLIRRSGSLVLVPADEKIDPIMIPLISEDELPDRGETEIVRVQVNLTHLLAESVARERTVYEPSTAETIE